MYMTNGRTRLSTWDVQASTSEVTTVETIKLNHGKWEDTPNIPVNKNRKHSTMNLISKNVDDDPTEIEQGKYEKNFCYDGAYCPFDAFRATGELSFSPQCSTNARSCISYSKWNYTRA